MKKLLKLLVAGTVLLALGACGGGGDSDSPVKSFNFADLGAKGYGVEFDDGDAWFNFGCGNFTRYDETGTRIDEGTFRLVGDVVEVYSNTIQIDLRLQTDASAPGEIEVGRTYQVTELPNTVMNTKVTWIEESINCP